MQGSKGKDFYIEYSSSKVQFSSATSMYQIESVVTKKHEIEKRQCIKINEHFWENLDYQLSDARNESTVSWGMIWHKLKAIYWKLDRSNRVGI